MRVLGVDEVADAAQQLVALSLLGVAVLQHLLHLLRPPCGVKAGTSQTGGWSGFWKTKPHQKSIEKVNPVPPKMGATGVKIKRVWLSL